MPTRTTIELYSEGCRLVEVDAAAGPPRQATADVRVRAFVRVLPGGADDLSVLLAGVRQERRLARAATVIVWGLRTTQQFLRLPPAKPADLELIAAREARKDLAPFDADGGATLAVAVGDDVQVGATRRREVAVLAASSGEVLRRIAPVTAAGFVVDRVVTPSLALADVARMNRDTTPSTVAAYVAIGADATCIAIVRGSLLLFAREMPWGHREDEAAAQDGVAARLTSELRRSVLYFKQTFRAPVEMVLLCGEHPKLRSLTAPLSEALRVPVQTLDSLVGIDAVRLPEPADDFRATVAALRPAIACASVVSTTNLLPAGVRKARESRQQGLRLAAAIAAAVLLIASWFTVVQRGAAAGQREMRALQQQIGVLEPQAARADALRQARATAVAQRTTLGAFESQGPRLARVLEAISRNTPQDVVVTGIDAHSEGVVWRLSITGTALTEDAATGQAALNDMLTGLSQSPYLGAPVESPAVRMLTGTTGTDTAKTGAIPVGMSGVEFTMQFDVRK